jgi:phosphopantetheine--protein transferase-like protein
MPLFYQHNINEATKLGVWKIDEPESFFLEKVPLRNNVSNPYKRLQHLAGRYLLPELFNDFPLEEIAIADTRKPFLENEQYHFSISHCGNYAAAIVSSINRVGVDIELVTPRIKNIAAKFLNDDERKYLNNFEETSKVYLELITVCWSTKEAIFKWYGKGGLDFKENIKIISITNNGYTGHLSCVFEKEEIIPLQVHYHISNGFVVAWVYS